MADRTTRLRAMQFAQLFDKDNAADHIEATLAVENLLNEWSEAGTSVEMQDAVIGAAFTLARRSVDPSSDDAVPWVVSAAGELMRGLAVPAAAQPASGGL